LENFSARVTFRRLNVRDNALDEIKKVSNKAAHGKPPNPKIKPPVRTAAHAPLLDSEPARHAIKAMMIANRKPMNICICSIRLFHEA
jgi:hypothetical protein